jgi:hypothetical protein
MLTRTQESLGLMPRTLAADAAYGSDLMLGWLMGREVKPHIPILDHAHQTKGYFTRADFMFDAAANAFVCPAGKHLLNNGLVREDGTMPYRASTKDCRGCALKERCTKGVQRIVTPNLYEAERQHVRELKETPAFKHSARLRKKVEMRFGHLKRIHPPAAIARTNRREGRVLACRYRTKPPKTRSLSWPRPAK